MSIRCPHALCASGGRGWRSERLLLLLLLLSACLLEVATVGANAGATSRKVPCGCNCPQPPTLNLTEAPAAVNCCTNGGRFRYTCVVNHLRKAGTSNLAACTLENGNETWSKPNLVCIPDPRIVITTTPPDVNPTPHAPLPSVPSTNQMAPESTANRGTHQPTPPTSIRSDEAPVSPATMLTHADAVLTTFPAPPTSPITTSAIPIPIPTTSSTPTTTTSTPTTTSSTTSTPATSTPATSSTTSTPTTSTPTTTSSTPTTTSSTPTTTSSTPTTTSPSPGAPGPDGGTPGTQGVLSSGAAVPTGLGLAAFILISAILGLSFCCWRRKRSANHPTGSVEPTPPEAMPLNPTPTSGSLRLGPARTPFVAPPPRQWKPPNVHGVMQRRA
ncbi:unnamed protein product [Arctogadus glacialis]